jgi:hypothetical protein
MAEPDVARFEALLTSRGRELLNRIATEAPGPDTALRIGASLRGLYPTDRSSDTWRRYLPASRNAFTHQRSTVRYRPRPPVSMQVSLMPRSNRA